MLDDVVSDDLLFDDLSRKIESKVDNKLISKSNRGSLKDGFKKGKVINDVLDKLTVMTLYKMITDHVIAYVNGSVSAGKESVVFWGVDKNNVDVALKIYLISTSNFKKREPYILGDPRFSNIKKGIIFVVELCIFIKPCRCNCKSYRWGFSILGHYG